MGNRAVITLDNKTGIYLHWNGGRDSVEAFLKYCKLRKFRTCNYGLARLTQVITNFIGGDLSVGVGKMSSLDCDNFDNGVYHVENWEIVKREFFDGEEQKGHEINEMLFAIDEKQPEDDRLFNKKELVAEKIKELEVTE